MVRTLAAIVLLMAGTCMAGIDIGAIGNEDQIGGWFGFTGQFTTFGFDGRHVKDYGETEEDTEVLSVFVSWNAVPKITIPASGLFPQLNLPGPNSVDLQLNLLGRLGYETEFEDIIATVGAELEILTGERASLAIRYEYAFDSDAWNELPATLDQHQAFLNLIYRLD